MLAGWMALGIALLVCASALATAALVMALMDRSPTAAAPPWWAALVFWRRQM